uniref:Olfactory receptor 70 n=1 Tax=Adelphocoris lineolatus TaxID=236346 RepID=A0A2I4PH83_ADELI|nr:olfactory receptor 70 [Adelphocoris lineolatus]
MKNAEEGQLTINDCILHYINQSVKHHQHTLRMMNAFKKLMFFPLFALVFDGGFILCMSSYMLINNDLSITLRVPMPCVIAAEATFAFIFCYYGGLLSEANEDVGNGIYDCEKWMYYSKVTSPYAIIIKGYCNIPNELSAGGFTSVNQRAFGSILSATYSYIGFMLST